jgi:hypothetical protein
MRDDIGKCYAFAKRPDGVRKRPFRAHLTAEMSPEARASLRTLCLSVIYVRNPEKTV